MITTHVLGDSFQEAQYRGFTEIRAAVEAGRRRLWEMPVKAIITLVDKLGQRILADPKLRIVDGIPYLCLWLRRQNLTNLIRTTLGDERFLDAFFKTLNNQRLIAQPRGLVCHWIAGNVLTLGMFSLVQSLLAKNGNVVKIPVDSAKVMASMLRQLQGLEVCFKKQNFTGNELLASLAVVSFSSQERQLNKEFSLIADAKIIWGGRQAVEKIVPLPQKETCHTIIFGPKYSFSVFDREFVEQGDLRDHLRRSVMDVVAFDQSGCSSPHVFFVEEGGISLSEFGKILSCCFEEISQKYPKQGVDSATATTILNARARYYLDPHREIIASSGTDWTILMDRSVTLEEPVMHRTVFLKEVDSLEQLIPLISKRVQTIGLGIKNEEKKRRFCLEAGYRGVDRFVSPGLMNNFDAPWDGLMTINHLVRWVCIKEIER